MYIRKQKCFLNTEAFLMAFFRVPNFQYLQDIGIFNFSIVSATSFCLITHINKLFQTVRIQKGRFKIC